MTFKVFQCLKHKLTVKMGAFGVEMRSSNFYDKITKLSLLSSFWGYDIPTDT